MLDSNIILGIHSALNCEEYSHAVLTQNYDNLPCGTPIVYPTNFDITARNHKTPVGVLICPGNGIPLQKAMVPGVIIEPIDIKPLYGNHKVITVSNFDLAKLDRLFDFIHDVGAITIVVEGPGRETLMRNVRHIEERFKYTSLFYYNAWSKKFLTGDDDKYVCLLTFLDLPYCVPLFNMRKVDGIGLSISGATIKASKEYGQLHRVFRSDFIYSNFEENVFVIDGVSINSKTSVGSDTYSAINGYAAKELPVLNEPLKKKKQGDKNPYRGSKSHFEAKYLSGTVEANGDHNVVFEAPTHQLYEPAASDEVPLSDQTLDFDAITTGHVEVTDHGFDNTTIEFNQQPPLFNHENTVSLTAEPNEVDWAVQGAPLETTPEEVPDEAPDEEWLDEQDPEGN